MPVFCSLAKIINNILCITFFISDTISRQLFDNGLHIQKKTSLLSCTACFHNLVPLKWSVDHLKELSLILLMVFMASNPK